MSDIPNILLVDDEENILNFMEAALNTIGANCILCKDGQQALNLIEENHKDHFQLIILDCLLPKVHGFDVLKNLKKSPRTVHIPIIMISGIYKKRTYKEDLLDNKRANGFLLKPFTTSDLLDEVEKFISPGSPPPKAHIEDTYEPPPEAEAPKKSIPTKGNLSNYPFPEIIRLLYNTKSTATIKLARENEKKIILLKDGQFIWALSNMIRHTIEHMLFAEGSLSLEQYYYFSKKSSSKQKNHIKTPDLLQNYSEGERKAILRKQMSNIISEAFKWYNGHFIIESRLPKLSSIEEIFLSTQDIIKTGVNSICNWEVLKNIFGSMQTRFKYIEKDINNLKLTFALEDLQLLKPIKDNNTLSDILKSSQKNNFETLQLLYIYTVIGAIEPEHSDFYASIKEPQSPIQNGELTTEDDEPVSTYKVITHSKATEIKKPITTKVETLKQSSPNKTIIDFYNSIINEKDPLKILNITGNVSKEEIKLIYSKLIKQYHPDKFYNKIDKETESKLQTIMTIISRAYKTTLEKYDDLIQSKPIEIDIKPDELHHQTTEQEDAKQKQQKEQIAKGLFIKGRNSLIRKDYQAAFSSFRYLNQIEQNNPEYQGYYGVSAYHVNQRTLAFDLFEKIKDKTLQAPDLFYLIGKIYIERNHTQKAIEFFNKALTFDPFHEPAQNALDEIQNPAKSSKDSGFFKNLFKK